MKWDKNQAQATLCQIDAAILDGIGSFNQRLYKVTGLHPLLLSLCTNLTILIMAAAIVVTSRSEGVEVMLIFLIMFSFFLWPSIKAVLSLSRIVKRQWSLSTYTPAMTYHVAIRPFWKRRIGYTIRCIMVFSLLFIASMHWPAPNFIIYLAAFCLLTPLEIYIRHSEPPVPEDGGKVSLNVQPSAA